MRLGIDDIWLNEKTYPYFDEYGFYVPLYVTPEELKHIKFKYICTIDELHRSGIMDKDIIKIIKRMFESGNLIYCEVKIDEQTRTN